MIIRTLKEDRLGEYISHPEVNTHRGYGVGKDLFYSGFDLDFVHFLFFI